MKAEYFQAVEETFLQCTGRGLSISEADRSHIEHWFKAGIPLQIVQHAVMETCTDREQKVRTISFARKAVEKEFTAAAEACWSFVRRCEGREQSV